MIHSNIEFRQDTEVIELNGKIEIMESENKENIINFQPLKKRKLNFWNEN